MPTPTDEELEIAIKKAIWMREHDEDENYVAKALLNHNYRLEKLNHVLDAAKHYIRSGNAPREHTMLMKAIEEAERARYVPGQEPHDRMDDVLI